MNHFHFFRYQKQKVVLNSDKPRLDEKYIALSWEDNGCIHEVLAEHHDKYSDFLIQMRRTSENEKEPAA